MELYNLMKFYKKVNKINVYSYSSGELIKLLKLTHQRTCRFLDKNYR